MVNNTLRSYLCGSPSSVGIRVSLIFPPPSNQWPCQFKTYGCSPSSVPTLLFFHFGGFLASPPCRRTSLQEQEFYAQSVAGASFTKKLAVEGWRLSPRAIPAYHFTNWLYRLSQTPFVSSVFRLFLQFQKRYRQRLLIYA